MYGILFLVFLTFSITLPQEKTESEFGTIYKFEFNNTAFPHNDRAGGHFYKGEHYKHEEHYQDQSTIVFIPKNYFVSDSVDLVFYFHGWRNNIDSSLARFHLIEQFYRSKKNAILVLTETAKNAPDSYGGHLEEKEVFSELVDEIIEELEDFHNKKLNVGNISLAGHSGAYRVMAYILMHGGLTNNIEVVYIFDGLYADIEKYSFWLDNFNGRFINIYTPNGGTKTQSENLLICLDAWGINYELLDYDNFLSNELRKQRIIFIKSELGHREVIHTKKQFQKFLESSM